MGKVRVQRYGQDIIDIVEEYCEQNNLAPNRIEHELEIKKSKPEKGETYRITLELFKSGKTLPDIARERQLTIGTIEGHIAKLIGNGKIKLQELPHAEKYISLKEFMLKTDYNGLTELRTKVGEDYSFGELRMVQAAIDFEKTSH